MADFNETRKRLAAGLRAHNQHVPNQLKNGPLLIHSAVSADSGPKAVGFLTVRKHFVEPGTENRTGKSEVVMHEKVDIPSAKLPGPNLVVTQAGDLMANMAAGIPNAALNYVELGDPSPATPPALTDSNLQQTTGQRKATANVVSGNVITGTALWLAAEGNLVNPYTEAGWFTGPLGTGTMFARKAGFSITKTASFQLQFQWMIAFSVEDACDAGCTGIALIGNSGTVEQYIYSPAGPGEVSVTIPIDFVVGANRIEFFNNGVRKVPTLEYNEAVIGAGKGVNLIAWALNDVFPDVCFFRHLRF